ncbi:MAG: hypothetical protein ACREBQ_05875 [Nitrososphaerales archaeon]
MLSFVFIGMVAVATTNAQTFSCPEGVKTVSICPSGCRVNTTGVENLPFGAQACYANNGETIPCYGTCEGEYVYTASYNGICEGEDGCNAGLIKISKQLIRDGRFAKVYTLDCQGNIRILTALSIVNNEIPTKATIPAPITKLGPVSKAVVRGPRLGKSQEASVR